MAISFREYPWYLQALIFFALALVIFGFGEYAPFSPASAGFPGLLMWATLRSRACPIRPKRSFPYDPAPPFKANAQ